jgi:choline dehydrogenase-like flavoprotein
MFQTPSQWDPGSVPEFDLCIVGAGAAGITIANRLKDAKIRTCLLEGCGLDYSDESQSSYRGASEGYATLDSCRLRFFGGTTNHWTGYCRPPEAADLRGWPIGMADVQPFLADAMESVGVQDAFQPSSWARKRAVSSLTLPTKDLREGLSLVGPPVRFKAKYSPTIEKSAAVTCVLNMNATEFIPTAAGDRIGEVALTSHDGKSHRLKAKAFVLACGGIENARLLLNSSSRMPKGVGNEHDMVGRFFADHCIRQAGEAIVNRSGDTPLIYELGVFQEGPLRIHPHVQSEMAFAERLKLPRVMMRLQPMKPTSSARLGEALSSVWRSRGAPVARSFRIATVAEPMADSKNRVTLLDERDRFGLRRAKLTYKPSELEVAAVLETVKSFGLALGSNGAGRVRVDTAELHSTPRDWGFHHYGTTRMHADPRQGVVDSDCRVHGLRNLFVAGSSVFPTAGLMTPTMTIVALALRLADKLKVELHA